jgi:biopolymer transport protein ExbD
MKTVFGHSRDGSSVDSMMTPMIDVVFLLLIFFLTTSSFQKLEKQLPTAAATPPDSLPAGANSEELPPPVPTDFNDIVIKLHQREGGGVSYKLQNQDVATLDELSGRMAAILKARSDVPIIIDPDRGVEAGEAILVYDLIRRQGSLSVFLVAK